MKIEMKDKIESYYFTFTISLLRQRCQIVVLVSFIYRLLTPNLSPKPQ